MSSPEYFLTICFGADLLNQEAQCRNVHFMLENQQVYNSMLQRFHILAKTGPCQTCIVLNILWWSLVLSKFPEALGYYFTSESTALSL